MALTAKQEAFARAYVETGNATEAYEQAYDVGEHTKQKTKWAEATRLLATPKINERIDELYAEAAERTMVTVESLCVEFEEARMMGKDEKQGAVMIQASLGKAKVTGLDVQRVDISSKDGSMSPNASEGQLIEQARRLGIDPKTLGLLGGTSESDDAGA